MNMRTAESLSSAWVNYSKSERETRTNGQPLSKDEIPLAIADSQCTAKHLTAGVGAVHFFVIAGLLHAFARDGFDWVSHPASMLSLGDLRWIQIAGSF
jgi:hypothetical protein